MVLRCTRSVKFEDSLRLHQRIEQPLRREIGFRNKHNKPSFCLVNFLKACGVSGMLSILAFILRRLVSQIYRRGALNLSLSA